MLLKLLRFVAAFVIGTALWWYVTPSYNSLLAEAAEKVLQADSRLRGVDLTASGRNVMVTRIPTAIVPADQLTYNVVLFLALFVTIPRFYHTRGVKIFIVCIAILIVTHVLALATSVESTVATQLKDWSEMRYTDLEKDVWTAAEYMYRLAGMFGIAFALWWVAAEKLKRP